MNSVELFELDLDRLDARMRNPTCYTPQDGTTTASLAKLVQSLDTLGDGARGAFLIYHSSDVRWLTPMLVDVCKAMGYEGFRVRQREVEIYTDSGKIQVDFRKEERCFPRPSAVYECAVWDERLALKDPGV